MSDTFLKYSTKNFKAAMDKLSGACGSFRYLRKEMGEEEWNKFTSHTAGFILSSMVSQQDKEDGK